MSYDNLLFCAKKSNYSLGNLNCLLARGGSVTYNATSSSFLSSEGKFWIYLSQRISIFLLKGGANFKRNSPLQELGEWGAGEILV